MALFLVMPFSTSLIAETESQFWPELDAYFRLSEQTRLFLQYKATREDDLRSYANGQIGGFLDIYMLPILRVNVRDHPDAARAKWLMFRVGYAYSETPPGSSKPAIDQIPTIEMTNRFPLPWDLFLLERNRGDLKFINGVFTPEYRNRLRLERIFKAGGSSLAPYVDTEIFYDTKYDAVSEIRYEGGMEWAPTHFLSLEGYYTRQHNTKSSPQYINAIGVKLAFYFNNPK